MKNRIKILQTIRQGQIGGGETHVLDLVSSIDTSVFEVEVLSFTEGPMVDNLRALGITTHVIKTTKPFNIFIWKQITVLIRERGIDILHAHGTRAASNCFVSAKKIGIPILYTVHGWSFHKGQNFLLNYLRCLGEKFILKNMSQTINVSRSNFVDGKKRLNLRNGLVIYNSINTSKFDPHKQYTNLRKEIGIAHDTTLVGFIARITHQKDPFTLLKAILKVTSQNANIHFLIVGNGDLEEDVKKFAKENNISRSITFLDFRNDIPNVLSAIDIYCLPSLWEGLPIGILEAMSMEKPVITTAIDTNTELICENSNGLLMEPGDSEKLAQHILFLHNNKSIRTKMGIRSREIIQTQFTIDKMIGKIQTLYQNQFNLNQTIKHNLA